MNFLNLLKTMFLPFGFFVMYEDEPAPEPAPEATPEPEPTPEPTPEQKPDLKDEIQKTFTKEEVNSLESQITDLKKTLATTIAQEKGGDTALAERLTVMEANLSSISTQLNQNQRLDTVYELLDRFPDLEDPTTGLPAFNYELPVEEMIKDAERLDKQAKAIAARRLKTIEQNFAANTNLTRTLSREEIKEQEQKDIELMKKGGKEGNMARARVFNRRLQRIHQSGR